MHESPWRMLLFFTVSGFIIFFFHYFFPESIYKVPDGSDMKVKEVDLPLTKKVALYDRNKLIKDGYSSGTRIKIDSPFLSGSVNLVGPMIDDLKLKKHKNGGKNSASSTSDDEDIRLLSPDKAELNNYIFLEWAGFRKMLKDDVNLHKISTSEFPNRNTLWKASSNAITVNQPVELVWQNSKGVKFVIEVTLDENYMFKLRYLLKDHKSLLNINETVIQTSVSLLRNAGIAVENNFMIHEGVVLGYDKRISEIKFKNVDGNYSLDKASMQDVKFAGFADKYWFVGAVYDNNISDTLDKSDASDKLVNLKSSNNPYTEKDFELKLKFNNYSFKSLVEQNEVKMSSNKEVLISTFMVFAGPKKLETLRMYSKQLQIPSFERIVDFGMLYFITRPIFILLNGLYNIFGNFGVALLVLTVLVKIALFPVAYIAQDSAEKMKKIEPKINKIKELYSNDGQVLHQNLMLLYKKEKIHPFYSLLITIFQIPVFLSLYKVLYVAIEMRHAPFGLWIKDLSDRDPTSILTLFGLIEIDLPQFLQIGILPLLMSLTMWLQQRMSTKTAVIDESYNSFMKFLPLLFLFVFSSLPSGLLLYWTWSNVLMLIQQGFISRIIKYRQSTPLSVEVLPRKMERIERKSKKRK